MRDAPKTIFQKIWDDHVVDHIGGDEFLLYVDRHLVHEVSSPQAFEGLRKAGRTVRKPGYTLAVADHNVPTTGRDQQIPEQNSRLQVEALERNVAEFGIPYLPLQSRAQGIVHVVGPELGLTLPGMTVACGDSHTSTHGAFGALAFGIGTSQVEHVLATQTVIQKLPKTLLVRFEGTLPPGVTAKDLVLALIGLLGTAGASGHVIEYIGLVIDQMSMAGRMTICNMAVEAGARSALIAPDQVTFDWLKGKPLAPHADVFESEKARWSMLRSDPDAKFDRTVDFDVSRIAPMVTWGTSPEAVVPVDGHVPDPTDAEPHLRAGIQMMLDYMGLNPGQQIQGTPIDVSFIGSCTNSRIEDLRAAAQVARGRRVAPGCRAIVVPGSGVVKAQAEEEGLARIFEDAGFEWREAGCSMCVALNADRLRPGERCASTSNRNFVGRQGPGGRTHLMSPPMAAAAAIAGRIVDVREAG